MVRQAHEERAIASAAAREAQEEAECARAELAEERRASQAAQAAASATTMWVRASASARVRAASGGGVEATSADDTTPAAAQPSNPECTGVMALRSASGAASGPWVGPTLLYAPSAPGAKKEWFSGYGIDNPTLLILPNGTSLLAGRTCLMNY